MPADAEADLERFVRGECDATTFTHREHVRMAYEILRRHSFVEAALHYSQGLRTMTERIGKSQKFHQTVTIAFLSLIAERIENGDAPDFEAFAAANAEVFDSSVLSRWYSPQRLSHEAARRTFLLPDARR